MALTQGASYANLKLGSTYRRETTMWPAFIQGLIHRISGAPNQPDSSESPAHARVESSMHTRRYEKREYSGVTREEFVIVGLQRVKEVLEDSRYDRGVKEDATRLVIKSDGEQRELTFPGAIPEPFFPQLFGARIELTINFSAFLIGDIEEDYWLLTEEYLLKVMSGDHQGQEYVGRKKSCSDWVPEHFKQADATATAEETPTPPS